MKLDDIQELWESDVNISEHELDTEVLKIPKLHSKYYNIYSKEKMLLYKIESELKILKLEKYEFYSQGHTKETMAKGWVMPSKGIIIKSEIPTYMEGDSDIITLNLRIVVQREKTEFLESIIKSLSNRGYQIKSAIDFMKWKSGG
jgi:hypothetical protein